MPTNIAVLRRVKENKGFGAKLARFLDAPQVTSGFRPKVRLNPGCVVVNYGQSKLPIWDRPDIQWINHPYAVRNSADKLNTFGLLALSHVPCLDWTPSRKQAEIWSEAGAIVYLRKLLRASKGEGIELGKPGEALGAAPLYTKHFPTQYEFRVFVADGQVIDIVQKKRMGEAKLKEHGLEEADELRRNYDRGWVFAHKNLTLTAKSRESLGRIAVNAIGAVGLHYGAVDMLQARDGTQVVCETNSSPALDADSTWDQWVKYFGNIKHEAEQNQFR